MISQSDKAALRVLMQSPQWAVVEQVAKEIIDQIRDQSCLKESEWETAKAVALEEGQVQGIHNFLKQLFNLASDV